MLIRKSKLKTHFNNIRQSESRRQEKIWTKKIQKIELDHKKELEKIKSIHYKELHNKNKEIKKSKDAWYRFKEKSLELVSVVDQLNNYAKLRKMNMIEDYRMSAKINESMEKIDRFILNNEVKINKLLGVDE